MGTSTIVSRLYSEAPFPQSNEQTNPTLLVSWWCTGFSLVIIFLRAFGRCVRNGKLFREDWVMVASVAPLLVRMALVHLVLLWGTNNVQTNDLSKSDIYYREIGSRLVLVARIFYTLFIWTAKFTISEFLRRLTEQIWRGSFQKILQSIRFFLAITFVAVVVATLSECQPFPKYWQVYPDPGPKCRQGYAHLFTMGACDVVTDLLLIVFPIPLVLISNMQTKRRVSLTLLFGLSLLLIGITCYRVPSVMSSDGNQQHRTLVASFEILAATSVSNAIVIGSFLRDRGAKKQKKYKDRDRSYSESTAHTWSRRATITNHHWGSDADLAGDVGIRPEPEPELPPLTRYNSAPASNRRISRPKPPSMDVDQPPLPFPRHNHNYSRSTTSLHSVRSYTTDSRVNNPNIFDPTPRDSISTNYSRLLSAAGSSVDGRGSPFGSPFNSPRIPPRSRQASMSSISVKDLASSTGGLIYTARPDSHTPPMPSPKRLHLPMSLQVAPVAGS